MKRKAAFISVGLALGIFETIFGWSVLPQNFLGGYLIFIGLGYCIGGGFFLAFSSDGHVSTRSDRSLLAMMPGAALILMVMPLEYQFLPAVLPRLLAAQWLGLCLILLSMLLRIWSRLSLRRDYQGNLQVRYGQQIVKAGPYRWVRHPGYGGFVLQALGLVIGFSSISGLVGLVLFGCALRYRILVEEQMLVREFGEDYLRYASHTSRLVPGIW